MSEYDVIAPKLDPDRIKVELETPGLDFNVCRTCLVPSASVPLFSEIDEDIGVMLVAIAGVALEADDGLPEAVCESCAGSLRTAYAFRLRAQQSDLTLRNSRLFHHYSDPFYLSAEDNKEEKGEEFTMYLDNDRKQYEEETTEGDVIKYNPASSKSSNISVKEEEEENLSFQDYVRHTRQRAQSKVASQKVKLNIDQTEHSVKDKNATNVKKKRGRPRKEKRWVYPSQCEQCGVVCCNNSLLRLHMRSHTGERPFVCSHCGVGFRDRQVLILHMKRHLNDYNFYCDACGKGFYKKYDVIVHNRKHTGEKPFNCTQCDRSFSIKYNLAAHMRRVHQAQTFGKERPATAPIIKLPYKVNKINTLSETAQDQHRITSPTQHTINNISKKK